MCWKKVRSEVAQWCPWRPFHYNLSVITVLRPPRFLGRNIDHNSLFERCIEGTFVYNLKTMCPKGNTGCSLFLLTVIAPTHFKEHVSVIFHANNVTQFIDHVHLFLWLHFGFSVCHFCRVFSWLFALQIRVIRYQLLSLGPSTVSNSSFVKMCILYISLVLESFPIQLPVHCFSIF